MPAKVFISHRNKDASNGVGNWLRSLLEPYGFIVWIDRADLKGGVDWENSIIDNLLTSDVVIVLLEEETDSEWVKREINLARGSLIEIIPLPAVATFNHLTDILQRLGLPHIQAHPYMRNETEAQALIDIIRESVEITINRQKAFYERQGYGEPRLLLNPQSVIIKATL